MAETVGQHSVAAFTSPVNGTTPIDANTVRGNDNTVRSAYVDHDADPGIHVQSSSLASRPTAGTAGRKWITVSSGRYQLWYDDGSRWHEVASDAINVDCLADANLAKGDVVKITGFNNGQNLPTVNKVTASTDTAFGVVENTVTSGNIVQIVNTGLIEDVDTNGYAVGTILYPNTSGGWTTTKPTSGNYQPAGFVLRGNSNSGVLFVEFSAPRIVERSDNTASTLVLRDASGNFAAGTITAGALTSTGLVTFASLKGTGATTVTNILDEDNMASDSATALATQQSIKAYVDAQVATVDTLAEVLANGNTTGANNIIVSSGQKITTNTIDETSSGVGVTIDSVLLKDDVVNATDIEVDTISANNGTLAVTLGSTGVATIAQQPILSSLTASQAVFTDASKGLVSNAITGTGNVVMSASPTLTGTVTAATLNATTLGGTLSTAAQPNVTSLGTLSSLAVTGNLTLGADVVLSRGAADRLDLASGDSLNVVSGTYKIANTDVLSATTLGSGVTASSLTSVGTLTSLTVSGDLTVDTSTLKVDSTNNRVGIGTASPSRSLTIEASGAAFPSASNPSIRLNETSSGRLAVIELDSGQNLNIWNSDAGAGSIRFYRGSGSGTESMRLDASGNLAVDTNTLYVDAANNRVGVGTATPAQALDVAGNSVFGTHNGTNFLNIERYASGVPYAIIRAGSTDQNVPVGLMIQARDTNGSAFDHTLFDSSGNLGLGVTPSAWSVLRAMDINTTTAVYGGSNSSGLLTNAYYDGVFKYKTTNTAGAYEIVGNQHRFSVAPSGTAGNTISFTQAMTLNASGNLGVGPSATSPASIGANYTSVDIRNTTGGGVLFGNATDYGYLYSDSNGTYLASVTSKPLTFLTNNTERARITSGGVWMVGTTGLPLGNGSAESLSGSNAVSRIYGTTEGTGALYVDKSTNTSTTAQVFVAFTINAQNTGSGQINANGASQAAFGSFSDARLKENIVDLPSQWDAIKTIRPVEFDYIESEGGGHQIGFIAQEVETVYPDLVSERQDGMLTLTGLGKNEARLIKALQEAMARIEALEARLEALEA